MEFNIDPYYDDFEDNAKDNNYVRVLFKPGRAVQARELTQIQSILQNQIKQFGDHIFQDGSPVIGGNLTLDNKVRYIKLLETYNNVDIEIEEFDRKIIRNETGGIQAKVLATYFPPDGIPTLIVKYLTGVEFADGDIIKIAGTTTQAQLVGSNASGQSTVVSINEGVFYVDGYFVQVSDQSVVADAYGVTANVKVGLEINDTIVDSEFDTTLLDPAQGSFNYQAPGADRYQFNLTLSTRPLDSIVDEAQFFELMRLENGIVTKQVKYPVYAELEKTLARRTSDESGDYTVRPFRATIQDAADANNYVISVEPGKAYVKGFEFETLGTYKLEVEKPRGAADVKSVIDNDIDTSSGNYLYVTSIVTPGQGNAFINVAGFEKVDIHCAKATQVNVGLSGGSAANGIIYQNTKIGTARVRDFIREDNSSESVVDGNGVYRLYLSDVSVAPKILNAANGGVAGWHTSNTINIASGQFMPRTNGIYANVSLTVLPIKLDAIQDVFVQYANSFTINANNSGTFAGKVSPGDLIRVGDFTKEVVSVSGGNLTVNSAYAYTYANSSSNPVIAYKQSAHTQNVTGQTRVVSNSWWQSNYATLELETPFDNLGVPDSNTVIQLNFGVDDAECIMSGVAVANSLLANINVAMNVSIESKLINGDVFLSESTDKTFIYPLPAQYVKRTSINNADYVFDKMILNYSGVTSPGVFTINLTGNEKIPWASTTSAVRDNLIVVVRDKGASSTPNGSILQLTSANVTVSTTSIDIDTGDTNLVAIDVVLRVKLDDSEDLVRTKSYYANSDPTLDSFNYPTSNTWAASANAEVILNDLGHVATIDIQNGFIFLDNPTYNAVRPGDSLNIFVPDVIKVNKVLLGNTTHLPDADNVIDITNNFTFDYGQRDNKYDYAKLILKQGYNAPRGKMLVHVNLYHHVASVGANKVSFFGPSSYSQTEYDDNLIPVYKGEDGNVYNLRDCLDFRPTKPIGFGTSPVSLQTIENVNVPNIPNPDSTTELSFEHYLPRIDKLVLSKDKEFRVIKGKASTTPAIPKDADDAMTLYILRLPPYVNDTRLIRSQYVENKRFTMKDISKLDKRIEKLEFFVSLNNIENLAMNDKTLYEDNTEKEKYGIVGENFRDFNIANFRDPAFLCALDSRGGVSFLTPRTTTIPLSFQSKGGTNSSVNKKTLTLSYTETPAIVQDVCSDKAVSVQPFLFGQFNGIIELFPETDFWSESKLKPEVITVPERIIEHTTVIQEIIREPAPPVTIINPVTVIENVIIREPAVLPPAPPPAVVVPVQPPEPVPVIEPTIPAPPPPPPPPPEPYYPPEPLPLPWEPPFFLPPIEIIDIGQPPISPWLPPPEPLPEPSPETGGGSVDTGIVYTGGGGGCVVLESFIPTVDQSIVNGRVVKNAWQLIKGLKISLGKEDASLEPLVGEVVHISNDMQPCVRISTETGISLVCSTTAPIFTKELEFIKAPLLIGKYVAVMRDGQTFWDKVIMIEDVGIKFVAVIDTGNNSFWAGEQEGEYILHHNVLSRWNYEGAYAEFRMEKH